MGIDVLVFKGSPPCEAVHHVSSDGVTGLLQPQRMQPCPWFKDTSKNSACIVLCSRKEPTHTHTFIHTQKSTIMMKI